MGFAQMKIASGVLHDNLIQQSARGSLVRAIVLDNGLTTYYRFVRGLAGGDAVIANSATGRDYSVGSSVMANGQGFRLPSIFGTISMVFVRDGHDLKARGH